MSLAGVLTQLLIGLCQETRKIMDPMFDRETFERELREYIVPEVVDAYLSADRESLRQWCGEAVSIVFYFEIVASA